MVRKVTKTRVISLFVNNYDKKYYLRELADLIGKPHQTIKPYVEMLIDEKILLKNRRKNVVEYSLNFKNKQTYNYLIIAEKEKLIEKLNKDILLKVLFERLYPFFTNNTFLIFGSSVEKIQKGSDIDLLVIGKTNIHKTIDDFEEIYSKKIHYIKVGGLDELNDTLIKEVYKKHILFNNTGQLVRFFGELHEKNKLV